MGNDICTTICSQKKNANDVALPTIKSVKNSLSPDEILKVVLIQRFVKNLHFRRAVKNQIIEIKNEKRKSVRDQICNFKESWDLFFKEKTSIEFSINGLQRVRSEINDYYTKFFKLNQLFGVQKECTITMTENKISNIKNSETFTKEFKIPLLKFMTGYFSLADLQYELDKYIFQFERVKFTKHSSIEEINTLENEENLLTEEKKKNVQNEIENENENKSPRIEISNIEEDKNDDVFYNQKFRSFNQLNFYPQILGERSKENNASQLQVMNDSSGIWFKKDTMSSNKTNWKTNCTNDNPNRNQSPDLIKRQEGKRATITIKSEIFTLNLIKANQAIHTAERSKIPLISSGEDYNKSKSMKVNNKYNSNSILKLESEKIIEKISEEKEKGCGYISFRDKHSSVFYQGGWHLRKLCKYGLGTIYMVDSTRGMRYKYYGYFKDDMYHGVGMLQYEDGYFYYGEFRNGFQSGFGIEFNKNCQYMGFFKNGKYHGFGESRYNQKVLYCGNYSHGLRDGYGILFLTDGSIYCGSFKNNKMEGTGCFQWPSGHKYFGNWKNDKMQGFGSYRWAKGDRYVGYYENDLRHGQGEYSFDKNKAVLVGKWKFSKKEGRFELHEASNIYVLNYQNDIQI